MGWFDEQIKQRKLKDEEVFEEAFIEIADAVLGEGLAASLKSDSQIAKDAIDEIVKYYNLKTVDVPAELTGVDDQLEYIFRPHGIMRRNVKLPEGWYKDAIGPMLAISTENGNLLATRPTFGGKLIADILCWKFPYMATVKQNTFKESCRTFLKTHRLVIIKQNHPTTPLFKPTSAT